MKTLQIHNTLVRDKTPEILHQKGISAVWHHMSPDEEFLRKLLEKFKTDLAKFEENFDPKKRLDILADMKEVMHALAEEIGENSITLESARTHKVLSHGGFRQRIILESTEE